MLSRSPVSSCSPSSSSRCRRSSATSARSSSRTSRSTPIGVIGLNILTGYTGQISLGHGAFMAVGGYTTAILMVDHGVKDIWTIPVAGLVAGLAGFLFGIPALRLSGLYLALATFAIAVATPAVIKKFEELHGWRHRAQHLRAGAGDGVVRARRLPGLHAHVQRFHLRAELGRRASSCTSSRGCSFAAAPVARCDPCATARPRRRRSASASRGTRRSLSRVSAFYAGVAGALFAIATTFVNPGYLPRRVVDLPARRCRRRRARVARRDRVRRDRDPVPARSGRRARVSARCYPGFIVEETKRPGAPAMVYGVRPDPADVRPADGRFGFVRARSPVRCAAGTIGRSDRSRPHRRAARPHDRSCGSASPALALALVAVPGCPGRLDRRAPPTPA